jgi:acyl-CoA reductase-like NAD-dependent aldehyde dehydrogenase
MTDTRTEPGTVALAEPRRFGHFIAGEWAAAHSGATFESRNPATAELIATFAAGGPEDVAMAVRAAETALPRWKATPAPRRGELL